MDFAKLNRTEYEISECIAQGKGKYCFMNILMWFFLILFLILTDFLFFNLIIYSFTFGCVGFSFLRAGPSSCVELGLLLIEGSVVVAHTLQSAGSVVVAHGLSCSMACRILPDQDLNLCPLHWQVDS